MIDFLNVTRAFNNEVILRDVSFKINAGERVGIVGPNGAGKSTLFNLLTGELTPDKGQIAMPSSIRLSYLHQQALQGIDPQSSLLKYTCDAIAELHVIRAEMERLEAENNPKNIERLGQLQHRYEVLGAYHIETDAKIALAGLGFRPGSETNPMATFSGGWQMRAALARVLIANPDVLLLDEPSNYLDVPAIEWLDKFLTTFRGTLLLISHDRFLLRTLCTSILEVNNTMCTRYAGDYNYYVAERLHRAELAENQLKNFQRERDRLQNVVERFRYKAGKAAMAQATIKQIARMDAEAPVAAPEKVRYAAELQLPDPPPCGTQVVTLTDGAFAYTGDHFIFRHVNLEIPKGEKVAIVGYNGMGKTTLLRCLAGRLQLSEGTCVLGHNVKIGYQAQEFSEILPPENTAFEIVRAALDKEVPSQNIRNVLGAFGFGGTMAEKPVRVLSGGEKIRLCFARIFVNPPNLLILDEPTTHLDIHARESLQKALAAYAGTCLFVSHDIEFLRNTATHIIAITEDGVKRYYGSYAYYLSKRAAEEQGRDEDDAQAETAVNPLNLKEQRRIRAQKRAEMNVSKRQFETEIATLEQQIESDETEQKEIIETLSNPTSSTDFPQLSRRQKELASRIEQSTARWETLTDQYTVFMEEYKAIDAQ